ncbi:hypothetical protein GCM10011365_25590 [Marinicella pacifica]|uniref:Uncharacterized protein n=1 Tax=Marinicella pacifica TaxID=1171543 RepID=A0A917CZ45_9GAMM|nr:hypothetical protein [Marinicella pacifica]GGG03308.1 hypothetical protein GCM10011365_25590 [Marinicella pacifica]
MTEYIDIDVDEDEFRLFNRLLLSYNDFKQAHEIASVLLESGYYDNVPENRTLILALNLTVIIAYSRPFKTSRGKLVLKTLPKEILSAFDSEQMEVHQQILYDRDTMMAHSDAGANDVVPKVLELGNRKILVPMNASPYATPLLRDVMEKVATMAYELQERTFEMRMEIEPRIIDKLPVERVHGET